MIDFFLKLICRCAVYSQREGSTSHLDPKHAHVLRRYARSAPSRYRRSLSIQPRRRRRTNEPTNRRRGMATHASTVLRGRTHVAIGFMIFLPKSTLQYERTRHHFDNKFLYPRPILTNFSSSGENPLDGFDGPSMDAPRAAKGSTGAPGSARHAGRECRDEPREINFSFIERGRRAMRVDDDDDDDGGDGDDGRASDRARRASRVDHANGRRPQARWVQRCVHDDATRDARRDEAKTLRGKYTHASIDAA